MNENMNKRIYDEYFEKLSKLIETQNKLYFNSIEYNPNNFNLNENYQNNNTLKIKGQVLSNIAHENRDVSR